MTSIQATILKLRRDNEAQFSYVEDEQPQFVQIFLTDELAAPEFAGGKDRLGNFALYLRRSLSDADFANLLSDIGNVVNLARM